MSCKNQSKLTYWCNPRIFNLGPHLLRALRFRSEELLTVRIANEQYDAEMSPRLFWFEPTLAFSARLGKTIEAFLLVLHVVQFIEAHLVVSRYD